MIFSNKLGALVVVLTSVGGLAGCESLDRMEVEGFQKECDNLGIARNTPTYDECMLQQQALEKESVQNAMDRSTYKRHK